MTSFTFGGTALTSFGNVTLIDDYLSTALRRGGDVTIPFEEGEIFVPKYYSGRTIIVGIAIDKASATLLEQSLDTLRALISLPTEQVLAETLADTSVRNINASVNKELGVKRKGPTFARVVIEFKTTKPHWRSNTQLTSTTVINASPKAITLNNTGSAQERNPTIVYTGPLQNTVIANPTAGFTLTYTGTIASPRVVTLVKSAQGEYTATDDLGANMIGNFSHTSTSGDPAWMAFSPGNNAVSVTDATATTGTVGFSFYPPFG